MSSVLEYDGVMVRPDYPDVPCAGGCGRMCWRSQPAGSMPATCHECRRNGRGPNRAWGVVCRNPVCEQIFDSKGDKRRKFCSRRCAASRGLLPGESRERRKAGVRARRAIIASTWDGVTDRQIFERDDWQCQISDCALGPLRADLLWPEALSPSIDHIVPLSRGGTDVAPNKRAAHLYCNIARHNRMTPDEENLVMPELAPLGIWPRPSARRAVVVRHSSFASPEARAAWLREQ